MPPMMRYTLAGAAILIALLCSVGWVVQSQQSGALGGQLLYAAGAGFMIGLAIWAVRGGRPDAHR